MIRRCFPNLLFRGFSSRTSVINNLQNKFRGKVIIRDVPESSMFNSLPKMDQQQAVLDSLPNEWKSNILIETNGEAGHINREVRMVHLRDVNELTGEVVRATPQSLLDDAVYNLKNKNGLLASESLWLCGSLALKLFANAYSIDLKNHIAKSYLVKFIASQYGKTIYTPWKDLERCHSNAYEDLMLLEMIEDSLEKCEQFCNLLYEYHCKNDFDFEKAAPKWLQQDTITNNGVRIKKFDLYFRVI